MPIEFKSGILTSIPKRGKIATELDNHRGITVVSLLGKVFEHILLKRYKPTQNMNKHKQFGFTEGHNPTTATLLLNESIVEAKENNLPLLICTLDARKAFDTVNHQSLIRKLYLQHTDVELVGIINSLYKDMKTQVKLDNKLGEEFTILQGTRQGSILSPSLYKTYINDLLQTLENHDIGAHIGDLYVATPTGADDVSVLSNEVGELQTMLDVTGSYANQERYTFNASKSDIANLGKKYEVREVNYINDEPIFHSNSVSHLGISHSNIGPTNNDFIVSKISLLFRTTYSLMGTGLHGWNGVGPSVAFQIYRLYVLPRFLYGMSAMCLSKQQVTKLESAYRKIIRQIQCLPERTAKAAVYLLPGQLPFEAHLDLARLSLLNSIIHSENKLLLDVLQRQLAMKNMYSNSWFVNVSSILQKYNLPLISRLVNSDQSKDSMKMMFKKTVNDWWTRKLKEECHTKKTLAYVNIDDLSTTKCHPVWSTVRANCFDVQRSHVKAKLLTDTYLLQSHVAKFKKVDDDICKLCKSEAEDRGHFLIQCTALVEVREIWLTKIKDLITNQNGNEVWEEIISDRDTILKVILDNSLLRYSVLKQLSRDNFKELETLTRIYCFKLHFLRCQLLQKDPGVAARE